MAFASTWFVNKEGLGGSQYNFLWSLCRWRLIKTPNFNFLRSVISRTEWLKLVRYVGDATSHDTSRSPNHTKPNQSGVQSHWEMKIRNKAQNEGKMKEKETNKKHLPPDQVLLVANFRKSLPSWQVTYGIQLHSTVHATSPFSSSLPSRATVWCTYSWQPSDKIGNSWSEYNCV